MPVSQPGSQTGLPRLKPKACSYAPVGLPNGSQTGLSRLKPKACS